MLYCNAGMPIVFILARDWPLRVLLRAELRERGVQAIGMQTAAEVGTRIASGDMPSVVVLEASLEVEPGLESLARRVPFIVVASGAEQDVWPAAATTVLHRPVRIAEVVAAVLDQLRGRPA
jgi:DNA-binding response OmpR family regulator